MFFILLALLELRTGDDLDFDRVKRDRRVNGPKHPPKEGSDGHLVTGGSL